jgi:hypothetical protein
MSFYCRGWVVTHLRAALLDWTAALNNREFDNLHQLVRKLLQLNVSPAELRACRGLGDRTRASFVDPISCNELKRDIILLRTSWKKVREHEGSYNCLMTELQSQPNAPGDNVLNNTCWRLVLHGFSKLCELEGAAIRDLCISCDASRNFISSIISSLNVRKTEDVEIARIHCILDLILNAKDSDVLACSFVVPTGGPRRTIGMLDASMDFIAKKRILDRNRIQTVIRSLAGGSRPSYRSGVRCFLAFHERFAMYKVVLPPSEPFIMLYASMFKHAGTFSNYLAHLKWACQACDVPCTVFDSASIGRARAALKSLTVPAPRRWIRVQLVRNLMTLAASEGDYAAAVLYAFSYSFMLRVPSEALPTMFVGEDAKACSNYQCNSCFVWGKMEARLFLKRTKNDPHGCVITRRCSCGYCAQTCPVHSVAAWMRHLSIGSQPFVKMSPAFATRELRRRLSACVLADVDEPRFYSLHAFRRGGAQDLSARGTPVEQVLLDGRWRSGSIFRYVDCNELNTSSATALFADESESEGEDFVSPIGESVV